MDQGADRRQQPTIAIARLMDAAQVRGAVSIQRMRVCLDDGEGFLIRFVVSVLIVVPGDQRFILLDAPHRPGNELLGLWVLFLQLHGGKHGGGVPMDFLPLHQAVELVRRDGAACPTPLFPVRAEDGGEWRGAIGPRNAQQGQHQANRQ